MISNMLGGPSDYGSGAHPVLGVTEGDRWRLCGGLSSERDILTTAMSQREGALEFRAAFIACGPGVRSLISRCLEFPGSRHRHSQEGFP